MFVAVVGCGHGEIDRIYEVVASIEERREIKVSLVLCCGDFQSVRNMTDLRCMACPVKYQQMHDFHRYYSGEKAARITTVFIGGNHEASNYLQELPYGGWVAPNIYFLSTGIVQFGSIRIGGVSGIFKGRDYLKGKCEAPPYSQDTMRSVYHYRNLDIFRMKQVKIPIDIMISHDWPKNVNVYGDTLRLLRQKPFFREEIERDELGSGPLTELLHQIQPSYWFSAHMHVKFAAVIPHKQDRMPPPQDDTAPVSQTEEERNNSMPKLTKFLALDKILPRRQFLQIIEFPDEESSASRPPPKLSYDSEWLAILKSTNHLLSVKPNFCYMPGAAGGSQSRFDFSPTDEETEEILTLFEKNLEIPDSFTQTAPPFQPGERPGTAYANENPQTVSLCQKLCLSHPLQLLNSYANGIGFESLQSSSAGMPNRYYAGGGGETPFSWIPGTTPSTSYTQASHNPDEISLDDDEDDGEKEGDLTFQSFASTPSTPRAHPSATPTLPVRKKLELPPPKASSSTIPSPSRKESEDDLKILESILAKSGMDADEAVEENPFFVIDKVGEPEPKKRRNAALYRDDSDST